MVAQVALVDLLVELAEPAMLVMTRYLHMVEHRWDHHQVLVVAAEVALVLVNILVTHQIPQLMDYMVAVVVDAETMLIVITHLILLTEGVVEAFSLFKY
jgi:hypothetical protein